MKLQDFVTAARVDALEQVGLLLVFIWEFPEIRGATLGVPVPLLVLFGDLYWAPPILGNYHIWSLLTKELPKP